MITFFPNQNIFTSSAQVLVNPVNCIGVMGAGLALQFKQKYPEYYHDYRSKCTHKLINLGKVDFYQLNVSGILNTDVLIAGNNNSIAKYICSFPTKYHWKQPSTLDSIANGMQSLVEMLAKLHLTSVALPKVGCGLGGADWGNVCPIIQETVGHLDKLRVELYT